MSFAYLQKRRVNALFLHFIVLKDHMICHGKIYRYNLTVRLLQNDFQMK